MLALKTAPGDSMYKTLGKAEMASLALSHGNSDAEMDFSTNKKVVAADQPDFMKVPPVLSEGCDRLPWGLSTMMSVLSNTCFGETCTRCTQSIQGTLG